MDEVKRSSNSECNTPLLKPFKEIPRLGSLPCLQESTTGPSSHPHNLFSYDIFQYPLTIYAFVFQVASTL
jgi:hypothetical protein